MSVVWLVVLGSKQGGLSRLSLRLSLNIPFSDIDDPRSLCRDVSGIGRWGNGDVEVGLSSAADLPYVMGLVRQALDRQLSAGD